MPSRKKTANLRIAVLQTDRGVQSRVSLKQRTVKESAEAMCRGKKFPAIEACRVGGELCVVDGFHRIEAAKRCGLDTIDAEVFDGTEGDAVVSKCSRSLAVVESEQSTQAFATADLASAFTNSIRRFRKQDHVPLPLVISLRVKVRNILGKSVP